MNTTISQTTYQSYRGLPTLAGLATLAEAGRPGLGIEECVSRLKRFHYAFVRLHEILTAHITAEPIYELKTAFAHHSYLCAEHAQALRARVGEMREPPLGLEEPPHAALQVFFDEILAAPNTAELLVGVYEKALPALDAGLARHMIDTNPLCDAPSVRVCRFARLEVADLIAFGQKAIACLVDAPARQAMQPWLALLDESLSAAGSLDGTSFPPSPPASGGEGLGVRGVSPATEAPPHPRPLSPEAGARGEGAPQRRHSATPYTYDPAPKRDERFLDLWNQGVNPEAFLYDPQYEARPKTLMMLFKRLREIDVPEMMASIIHETKGKPWGYYRDMSRQLWDEARHAMMGEVGFVAMGVDWTRARITHNWSMRLNTECTALERHAVLFFIEQGLMTRTGKRFEWEVGDASGDPLVKTIQDFDWADEVLHAQLGREWYVKAMGDLKKALDYGDQCWSRILSNWTSVREKGLTRHESWWPDVYRQACRAWGIEPDAKVLAYDTTYEAQRADLKTVSGSA